MMIDREIVALKKQVGLLEARLAKLESKEKEIKEMKKKKK